MSDSVKKIVDNALCCGCGMCAAICPRKAVHLSENMAGYIFAIVDGEKCNNCGYCMQFCPSNKTEKFRIDKQSEEETILAAYVGWATDPETRTFCQSGGVVTAVNSFLLSSRKIDAVATVRFNPEIRRTMVVEAKNDEELKQCVGSYYTQTPMCEVINDSRFVGKKISITLLGCQAQALSTYEKLRGTPVEYKIGLICSGLYSTAQLDQIIKMSKVDDVKGVRYKDKRHGKWPGNIVVQGNNTNKELPSSIRIDGKNAYILHRCFVCADHLNHNCDIVCGDIWGDYGFEPEQGYNLVIARTQKGLELLKEAEKAQFISLIPISKEKAVENATSGLRKRIANVNELAKKYHHLQPYSDGLSTGIDEGGNPSNYIIRSYLRTKWCAKKHFIISPKMEMNCRYNMTKYTSMVLSALPRKDFFQKHNKHYNS